MSSLDRFDLQRFVTAQEPMFAQTLAELRAGRKRSHWMWFIFPQLRGLGASAMAQFYGIGSLDEARAYLNHRLLGPRIVACTEAVLNHRALSLREIFGAPDDRKFLSSMSLFALAAPDARTPYREALEHWSGGAMDAGTLALLDGTPNPS